MVPVGIALRPDDGRAYVASRDGTVRIIDTTIQSIVDPPIRVAPPAESVAVSRDGARVYVGAGWQFGLSPIGRVWIFDATTGGEVAPPITVGLEPSSFALTSDGAHAYVTNSEEDTVSVLDTVTNTVVGSPITIAGFHPFDVVIAPVPGTTPTPTPVPSSTDVRSTSMGGGCMMVPNHGASVGWLSILNLVVILVRRKCEVAAASDSKRMAAPRRGLPRLALMDARTDASVYCARR